MIPHGSGQSDRIRQQVLEDRGWIIHRVWSTDWFQRPEEQLGRVEEAIAAAKQRWERIDAEYFKKGLTVRDFATLVPWAAHGLAPEHRERVFTDAGTPFRVLRLGPSPLPGDRRRCAFLEREEPSRAERTFDR